jgi:hypothetical protein
MSECGTAAWRTPALQPRNMAASRMEIAQAFEKLDALTDTHPWRGVASSAYLACPRGQDTWRKRATAREARAERGGVCVYTA